MLRCRYAFADARLYLRYIAAYHLRLYATRLKRLFFAFHDAALMLFRHAFALRHALYACR